MSQAAVQPGLSAVMSALSKHSARSAYFSLKKYPELSNKTFKQASKHFVSSVLCGIYQEANGKMAICPPAETIVGPEDFLLLIAGEGGVAPLPNPIKDSETQLTQSIVSTTLHKKRSVSHPKRYILLCFDSAVVEEMLLGFDDFSSPGSEVIVVCKDAVKIRKKGVRNIKIRAVVGHPGDSSVLRELDLTRTSSVVIAGLSAWPEAEADAQTLSTLLQIQTLIQTELHTIPSSRNGKTSNTSTPKSLHLVACMNNMDTQHAIGYIAGLGSNVHGTRSITLDLINSDQMLNAILAQVRPSSPNPVGEFDALT